MCRPVERKDRGGLPGVRDAGPGGWKRVFAALYVLLVKGCSRRVASSHRVRIRAGRPHSSRGRLSVTTSGAQGVCLAPRENRLSDRFSRVHATRAVGKGGDGSVGRRPHVAMGDTASIIVG